MTESNNCIIESLGVYLPPREVSSSDIIAACKKTLLYPMERILGIKSRRMAGEYEFAIDLARHAIEQCLERSRYSADEIDLLICCNISRYDGPNFQFSFEPSTSVRLRHLFGMSKALCFDISNACAGMFTGVNVADTFLKSGVVKNALVVSGEYITHLTRTAQQEILNERDERMACLTLGDSGAAVLLEQTDDPDAGFQDIEMYTLGRYSDCCVGKVTDSRAGGAIMVTDSVRIHAVAIGESVKQVYNTLGRVKWPRGRLKHFIMHQTGRSAIAELARQFNASYRDTVLDGSNMINNLENRGNTSSTTHFLAIWDNINNGRIQNGESVFFAVQASGITLGTAPYTFDDLPDRLRGFAEPETRPAPVAAVSSDQATIARPKTRVRIESLGTIPDDDTVQISRSAVALATTAAERCLEISKYAREEIQILIHSGVHREEFLCEPAVAALIAGKLGLNADAPAAAPNKTFAFDIINGAVSFLNACQSGVAMIGSGRFRNAMILAAEIENNAEVQGRPHLGLKETGSAIILEPANEREGGFLSFYTRCFTDHVNLYYARIGQEEGTSYLDFRRHPELNNHYLDCIQIAVNDYLKQEGIQPESLRAVFPPQISAEFVSALRERMAFPEDQVMALANGHDYYTSSTAYAMQAAWDRHMISRGDIGLVINVGTGIQVGCALYQF